MSMLKLVELNKTEVVRLNLNLAKPKTPIKQISSYVARLSYQKENLNYLRLTDYPFKMQQGAAIINNYKGCL